jgi:hypothetical protein
MDWTTQRVTTIDLGYEQMWLVESPARTKVRVLYGGVWLTEEGSARDAMLASGDEVALHARGLSVIEGLGAARIQVVEESTRGQKLVAWLQRLAARATAAFARQRQRAQLGRSVPLVRGA